MVSMTKKLLWASTLLAVSLSAISPAQVKFTDGNRIRYDSQCFTINGKDTFIYSGAFHYFRCPKELWADRFQKIKAAGFNTVETYIAWNWHEKGSPSGLNDFSKVDLKECEEWLKMAIDDFGLNVIVRPGPYICSEWDSGGYPQWLMQYRPSNLGVGQWLRTNDPTYLDWCRHWYKAVCPVVAPFQITHRPVGKPGVILFQIENEYDYSGGGDDVHIGQLKALADQAHLSGIDVPLVTCWTRQIRGSKDSVLSQVFDCCNFYPRWDVEGTKWSLDHLREKQPQAPLMVMEMQGGWFSENGGLLAEDQGGLTASQINNLTLYDIQNGLTALNYYMLFGGTNFGDRTPPNITTSYDYNAPIREDGAIGLRYQAVSALGAMLQEHGPKLARSILLSDKPTNTDENIEVAIRVTPEGDRYIFVRNRKHDQARSGETTIAGMTFHYDLEPFGSKVLYLPKGSNDPNTGAWLPKAAPEISAPGTANSVRIVNALKRSEDGGSRWQPAQLGVPFAKQGIYDSRYVAYSTAFDSPKANHLTVWLKAFDNQQAVVRVNGKIISSNGNKMGHALYTVLGLKPTGNKLEVLLENSGFPNGGPMDGPRGLEDVQLVTGSVPVQEIGNWWVKKVSSIDATAEVSDQYSSADFRPVTIESGHGIPELDGTSAVAVYRSAINLTQAALDAGQTTLEFGSIDDEGWVYVNGHKVGEHHQWDTPATFDVKQYLRVGANTIAVVVRNQDGIGGLTKPVMLMAKPISTIKLNWMIAPVMEGVRSQWFWRTNLGEEWTTVWLDGASTIRRKVSAADPVPSAAASNHLMSWYKMSFNLPAKRKVEATRRLLITSVGNGFIYLNGHLLGRIWQQGPQREYYLPENWLNWDDRANDLTICLRPVKGVESLIAAEVAAYPDRRNQ